MRKMAWLLELWAFMSGEENKRYGTPHHSDKDKKHLSKPLSHKLTCYRNMSIILPIFYDRHNLVWGSDKPFCNTLSPEEGMDYGQEDSSCV